MIIFVIGLYFLVKSSVTKPKTQRMVVHLVCVPDNLTKIFKLSLREVHSVLEKHMHLPTWPAWNYLVVLPDGCPYCL